MFGHYFLTRPSVVIVIVRDVMVSLDEGTGISLLGNTTALLARRSHFADVKDGG